MAESKRGAALGKVVESSIVPFSTDVGAQAREDILEVVRFAHATATDERNQGLNLQWFTNFRRKLAFLGWDATPPPIVTNTGADRETTLKSALEQIGVTGSSEHTDSTGRIVWSLQFQREALLGLSNKMREENGVKLQLMPCVRRAGDHYDMVLRHLELLSLETTKTMSFLKGELKLPLRAMSAELIRFNLRLFRNHYKDKVQARVNARNDQLVLDIPYADR